jgi:hypothetical protein
VSFPQDKSPLDEFAHFGVKGMHWGQRKAQNDTPNKNYSQANRQADTQALGAKGAARINQRLNKGLTYKQALAREIGRQAATRAAVGVGLSAVGFVLANKNVLASEILKKAETNRGRAAASELLGLGSALSKTPYAKIGRGGAYKITTAR